MDVVFRNCGCAISITIAVMIRMSRLTCAANVTVLRVGNGVPANQIIVVSRNGCSATVKTIVGIIATSCQRTVQNVVRRRTLSAEITDVFQSKFTFP